MPMKNPQELAVRILKDWNSHDLDSIMSHYSDSFTITSPMIQSRLGIDDGTLKGKQNVRAWWDRVLKKVPDLTFTHRDTAIGADGTLLVMYHSSHNDKTIASAFTLDDRGLISREVYYN